MLKGDILRAFVDHAIAHNIDSFSSRSSDTYYHMYKLLLRDYDNQSINMITDTLCIIDENGRISVKENFKRLLVTMAYIEK